MRVLGTYLFKMYRPGHAVFRYKTFLCWDEREAMEKRQREILDGIGYRRQRG